MATISSPNSTIDNTDITCDAIAAVAAIQSFTITRDLYKLITSMDRNSRQCSKNDYNTDGRCITCFAKHHSEFLIPQHYNTFSHIPWNRHCIICHTEKEHTTTHLCGSSYCMFTFGTIIKPATLTLIERSGDYVYTYPDKINIEWL